MRLNSVSHLLIIMLQNDGNTANLRGSTLCVIPKAEYESLSQLASQYTTLCANLLSGGIDQETISVSCTPFLLEYLTPAWPQAPSSTHSSI